MTTTTEANSTTIEDMATQAAELGLSSREQSVLRDLLDPAAKIEIILPDDLDPQKALRNLEICCRANVVAGRVKERSKLIIGRLLVIIHGKPSVYKDLGCRTFEDFLTNYVDAKLGFSRTDSYNAMRVLRKIPGLTPETYAAIGTVKMNTLAAAFPGDSEVPKKFLELAKRATIEELRDKLEDVKLIEAGEDQPYLIQIKTNKALGKRWREFLRNPKVRQECESDKAGRIFERMLDECSSSWKV